MPSEAKDDAPPKRKSEGITVFLRMRPTKHPSKFYDVGDNEGKAGRELMDGVRSFVRLL